jgi:hypothetical protein
MLMRSAALTPQLSAIIFYSNQANLVAVERVPIFSTKKFADFNNVSH